MLKSLNIIPIHFEQNLAHSKSIDVALIVRAGEICFGQNLAQVRMKLKRSAGAGNRTQDLSNMRPTC